jgi:para-nitrobenzyl esterase
MENCLCIPHVRVAAALALAASVAGCHVSAPFERGASASDRDASAQLTPDGAVELVASAAALRIQTRSGMVEGVRRGETRAFLGIPFAEPPVGALRFAPPVAVEPWSGSRRADAYGPDCPQANSLFANEDCLTLDVFSPSAPTTGALPVIVFIHGGGFATGGTADYDPRALSEAGPVVVVTIHYRLGALGFLAHPQLDAALGASSGNMGLRDQQLALRWVADNIRAFSGDPNNVTLFGQSAGAISTCLHMFAHGSEGLVRRHIMQSGVCVGQPDAFAMRVNGSPLSRADIFASSKALIEALCGPATPDPVACLRALPASALADWAPAGLEQQGLEPVQRLAIGTLFTGFGPYVDGALLSELPSESLRAGRLTQTRFIVGTTSHEWELFAPFFPEVSTQLQLTEAVGSLFREHQQDILDHYRSGDDQQARAAWVRLVSDFLMRCPTHAFARAANAQGSQGYVYRFTVAPAAHAQDLDYVFGHAQTSFAFPLRAPLPLLDSVVEAMQRAWTTFASEGEPSVRATPAVAWPRFAHDDETWWTFGEPTGLGSADPRELADCRFWASLYPHSGF